MMTKEVKDKLVEVLTDIVRTHQTVCPCKMSPYDDVIMPAGLLPVSGRRVCLTFTGVDQRPSRLVKCLAAWQCVKNVRKTAPCVVLCCSCAPYRVGRVCVGVCVFSQPLLVGVFVRLLVSTCPITRNKSAAVSLSRCLAVSLSRPPT
jgi:hypothetical protein